MDNSVPSLNISPLNEKRIITGLREFSQRCMKEGDIYYVVSKRWWKEWEEYVGQDASAMCKPRPQGIDNSDIVLDLMSEDCIMEPDLCESLIEDVHYVLLSEYAWSVIHKWYGGGPILARKMIDVGAFQKNLKVELYPLRLRLVVAPGGRQLTLKMSRKDSIGELYKRVREILQIGSEEVHIWNYIGNIKISLLNDMNKRLEEAGVDKDQAILLELVGKFNSRISGELSNPEVKGKVNSRVFTVLNSINSGHVKRGGLGSLSDLEMNDEVNSTEDRIISHPLKRRVSWGLSELEVKGKANSRNCTDGISSRHVEGRGLKGLENLGNTCYMNSALQCLVHTTELVTFFHEDFSKALNQKNPLGAGGKLASAFGHLLRELWAPGVSAHSPCSFKAALAQFAPTFADNNQEDTQEFLDLFLDGIHEDLNRVLQKRAIEAMDTDGRPDEVVANEKWAEFKALNDSIIVDLFHGQYRSKLVCQNCSCPSATFDAFRILTLSLPQITFRTMTVTLFSSNGIERPTQYTITVPKQGKCRDIIDALSSACSLRNDEKLLLAKICSNKISQYLEQPFESISTIKDYDCLAAYRLPMFQEKSPLLILMHRHKANSVNAQRTGLGKPYGTPLLAAIGQDVQTGADIQAVVQALLAPMLRDEHFSYRSHVESSFQLWLADEEGNSKDVPIEEDKPIPVLGSCPAEKGNSRDILTQEEKPISFLRSCIQMHVLIEWSDKELEKYDTKYIDNLPRVLKLGFGRETQKKCFLYTLLENYHTEEIIEDRYCSSCKEQQPAIKKLDFWRMPEVLILSLKRYDAYNRKLDMFVDFPVHELDLTKFVASNNGTQCYNYELFAVTNHYGKMGHGHYTADVKLKSRWYKFDDALVKCHAKEEDIKTSAAYVLFYRRVKSGRWSNEQ